MKSSPVKYLPLHPEIVAAATDVDRIWDKTFCPMFRSGSDNEILGHKHLDGKAVSLEFVDSETAKNAGSAIEKYQQIRNKLKYRFRWVPASEEKFKAYNTGSDRRVRVHSDDYIPGEFTEVLSDILWAAAHYCLVSSEMLSSMTAFVGTFSSFDVLAIDLTVEYETPDLRNIIALHKSLLHLAMTRPTFSSHLES